ncbi:MAG: alanine racemase [Lachnospiraceae bacterium]|nr:alanine racemase [Lachnospiraceae bacterium]
MDACMRGFAQVDLDAIIQNMENMKAKLEGSTKMLGVIKTDGYGHGALEIANCLEPLDFMYGFAVATAEEAFALRKAGVKKPIVILGYTFPYSFKQFAQEEIRPTVFREDMLLELSEAANATGRNIKIHIKVDTGMNRIGIRPDETGIAFVKKALAYKNLEVEGIFTHFSRADEADKALTKKQFQLFSDFVNDVERKLDITIPVKHCANSAGIIDHPMTNMDVVRAGIALYGLYPSEEVSRENVELIPALSLYSTIVYIKKIGSGESVSYGGTFTADHSMRIATIPIGYGDGYPRNLSGKGHVLIHGKKAPILGRVCMDQFMVDVTDMPEVKEGDTVILIGKDGKEQISVEMLSELSGRFPYELVCDLGKRIPRVFKRNGEIISIRNCFEECE